MDSHLYRTVGTVRAAISLTAAAVVFLVLAVVPGKGQLSGDIFAPLLALAAWRMWTAGIHTEPGGVKLVGLPRTRRIAWDDIDHFAVLPSGQYPWVGYVVLRDGRRRRCLAISAPARPRTEANHRLVQEPIDELNQILTARHTKL